jgi:hypothetical protein
MLIILVQEQTHTTHAVQQMDTQEVTALEQVAPVIHQVAPVIHQAVTVLLDLVTVLKLAVTVFQHMQIATLVEETVIPVEAREEIVTQANHNFQIVISGTVTVIHQAVTVIHQAVTATLVEETAEALDTA